MLDVQRIASICTFEIMFLGRFRSICKDKHEIFRSKELWYARTGAAQLTIIVYLTSSILPIRTREEERASSATG